MWQREGFGITQKRRKKPRIGISENGIARRSAVGLNDVWCMDFIHDSDERGRSLRWLTIVDEFTRECVALEVARSMTSDDMLKILVGVFRTRGVPTHIRTDNGPEFIAKAMRHFLNIAGVEALYIEPGSPLAKKSRRELQQPILRRNAQRRNLRVPCRCEGSRNVPAR